MWIGILSALISLIGSITNYIREKDLMDAGQSKALNDSLENIFKIIKDARASRSSVLHDDNSVRDDKNNRDKLDV